MRGLKTVFGISVITLLLTSVTILGWQGINRSNSNGSSQTSNSQTSSTQQGGTACIVTISGSKYDVTKLQSSHSGGNIFDCGTDMTSVFFSEHSSKMLSRDMSKYKIN